MSQHDSSRPPRFCPNCGAKNPAASAQCAVCGQQLVPREDHARLWGTTPETNARAGGDIVDLYQDIDVSSQATTPFTQTRPYDPADYKIPVEPAVNTETKKVDPWAAGSMRLGTSIGKPATPGRESQEAASTIAEKRRKGPPGCVLGCLAIVLIAAVSGLFAWNAIRGAISDQVQSELEVGITNQLRQIGDIPVQNAGEIVLSEDEINADLDAHSDAYEPIKNVEITIGKTEIQVRFKFLGVASTYHGGLDVKNGRIVITNPELDGPAGRILDAEEIAATFQSELDELLTRSGLEPVDVKLRKGAVVITTASSI